MNSRATSLLDVLNTVLSTLGFDECRSFDPTMELLPETEEGKKVSRTLLKSIDDVQRTFYWQELIKTETVAADATDHFDGRKRYPLPDACLRPIGVRATEGVDSLPATFLTQHFFSECDYEIEGGFLLTTAVDVDLLYIRRSDDPSEWSSELLDCIQAKGAVDACLLTRNDVSLRRELLAEYKKIVHQEAKTLQSKYKRNSTDLPSGFVYLDYR